MGGEKPGTEPKASETSVKDGKEPEKKGVLHKEVSGSKPIEKPTKKRLNVKDFVVGQAQPNKALGKPVKRKKKVEVEDEDSEGDTYEEPESGDEGHNGIEEDEIDRSLILPTRLRQRKPFSIADIEDDDEIDDGSYAETDE